VVKVAHKAIQGDLEVVMKVTCEEFIEFLDLMGVLQDARASCMQHFGRGLEEQFTSRYYTKTALLGDAINQCIIWRETPQGQQWWEDLRLNVGRLYGD
jgi:hypothetical protein